jgi:Kef-type K+ transport system membrane component KefB
MGSLTSGVHLLAALVVVLLIAYAGRLAARLLLQPAVIGEIAAGMAAAPLLVALVGQHGYEALLPADVLAGLALIGHAGLALFLVGVGYQLRHLPPGRRGGTVGWLVAGALLPALVIGAALGAWVAAAADPAVRGDAPTASLVLVTAVAFGVTAVPVLARILAERGLLAATVGRLAMATATLIDVLAWVLFVLSAALAARGGPGAVLRALAVLGVGLVFAVAGRKALAGAAIRRLCATAPRTVAVLLGAAGVAAATLSAHGGLTAAFGALLVGLLVPDDAGPARWSVAVHRVGTVGLHLVPVMFAVAGAALLTGPDARVPWGLMAAVVGLGCASKLAGAYAGARLGGLSPGTGARLAVMLNTRGLTEIVVLQAAYAAGLLSPALLVAFLAMTLVSTAMTGPVLSLIDRVSQPARLLGDPDGVHAVATVQLRDRRREVVAHRAGGQEQPGGDVGDVVPGRG